MSLQTQRAAQRIADISRRQAHRHGRAVLRTQVVRASPLRLEVMGGHDLTLDVGDDFVLTLGLKNDLANDPAEPGDTVLLHNELGVYMAFDIHKDSQDDDALPKADVPFVSSIPSVTSLPAIGRHGQELYFQTQAMATAASVLLPWHVRYRQYNPDGSNNASPYKWEVIGNPAAYVQSIAAAATTASGAYVSLGGPALVAPAAGEYEVAFGCQFNGGALPVMAVSFGTQPGFPSDNESVLSRISSSGEQSPARVVRQVVPNAGETIDTYYREGSGAGTASFFRRWLAVRPVRLR